LEEGERERERERDPWQTAVKLPEGFSPPLSLSLSLSLSPLSSFSSLSLYTHAVRRYSVPFSLMANPTVSAVPPYHVPMKFGSWTVSTVAGLAHALRGLERAGAATRAAMATARARRSIVAMRVR
jgi:hypothetical protein